jgi:hypothetical protein
VHVEERNPAWSSTNPARRERSRHDAHAHIATNPSLQAEGLNERSRAVLRGSASNTPENVAPQLDCSPQGCSENTGEGHSHDDPWRGRGHHAIAFRWCRRKADDTTGYVRSSPCGLQIVSASDTSAPMASEISAKLEPD